MPNKELGIADPVYDALRIRSGQSIAPDLGGGSTGTGGGLENKIYVWHADGSTIDTFDPDATGLGLALAAAASGDTVWLPSIAIALTAGVTVPAGVTVTGISQASSLNFSGFSGTGITLNGGSVLSDFSIVFDGTGQATAQIVSASGSQWLVQFCVIYVHSATNNIGLQGVGVSAVNRGFVEFSHIRASGGNSTQAFIIDAGGCVTISHSTAWAEGGTVTNQGLNNAASSSGNESILENCRFDSDQNGIYNTGYALIFSSSATGTTNGFDNQAGAVARVYDVRWSSLSNAGTITYLLGDRGAYSVEDNHASDIEAAALTRHLPAPTNSAGDGGKAAVLNAGGTAWVLGDVITPGMGEASAAYSEANVSNPPSEDDIIGAFGDVATVGPGYLGILNDNAAESHVYLCGATILGWWYLNLARVAALTAISLSILAGDSFTGANGTHLNVHTMDAGAGWTESSGSWTISSNAAVQATAGGVSYVVTTEASDANVKIHARVKTQAASGSQIAGIAARFTDTSNYWQIFIDTAAGKIQINEFNTGTPTMRAQKNWTARYQKYVDIDVTLNGNVITATFDGGYTLTYTSAFNATATKHGLFEYRDGTYAANTFEDFQVVDLPTYPWTRTGTVLSATVAWEQSNIYEPTVLLDKNPQILTADRVMKMWYTGGWSTVGIGYAESDDLGATWTKYSGNPVINNAVLRSTVVKFDGTYYLYGANAASNKIVLYTSTNGISWTLYGDLLSLGAGGQWDDTIFGNVFVWRESLTAYYMLYEAAGAIGGAWSIGLATSTDGLTWSKSGSNPVLTMDGGSVGGPWVKKIGSTYYLWLHRTAPDVLPNYIARYKSTNLTAWTSWPAAPIITRSGVGEGEDTYVGQAVDVTLVDGGATAYAFFAASSDGTQQSGAFHIVLATADARAIGGY